MKILSLKLIALHTWLVIKGSHFINAFIELLVQEFMITHHNLPPIILKKITKKNQTIKNQWSRYWVS